MLSFVVLGALAVQRANVELSTQLASSEGAVPDLTKAVKPEQLFKLCQEVAAPGLASPANAKAVCQRKIPDDKTCTFLSECKLWMRFTKKTAAFSCSSLGIPKVAEERN
jgi:hypothetical protein